MYEKRDYFTFPITNFPIISSNITIASAMECTFHNLYVMLVLVLSTVRAQFLTQ